MDRRTFIERIGKVAGIAAVGNPEAALKVLASSAEKSLAAGALSESATAIAATSALKKFYEVFNIIHSMMNAELNVVLEATHPNVRLQNFVEHWPKHIELIKQLKTAQANYFSAIEGDPSLKAALLNMGELINDETLPEEAFGIWLEETVGNALRYSSGAAQSGQNAAIGRLFDRFSAACVEATQKLGISMDEVLSTSLPGKSTSYFTQMLKRVLWRENGVPLLPGEQPLLNGNMEEAINYADSIRVMEREQPHLYRERLRQLHKEKTTIDPDLEDFKHFPSPGGANQLY